MSPRRPEPVSVVSEGGLGGCVGGWGRGAAWARQIRVLVSRSIAGGRQRRTVTGPMLRGRRRLPSRLSAAAGRRFPTRIACRRRLPAGHGRRAARPPRRNRKPVSLKAASALTHHPASALTLHEMCQDTLSAGAVSASARALFVPDGPVRPDTLQ